MNPLSFAGTQITDIAHAIQLSVAPVFLLSGVGVLLNVLTSRLARIVDRARPWEEKLAHVSETEAAWLHQQLRVLARRARHVNRAITLSTISALLTAIVVALLFGSAFLQFNLASAVALLFIVAMMALVGALLSFLIEVRIATAALRIGN
jgi:hypothetical protein